MKRPFDRVMIEFENILTNEEYDIRSDEEQYDEDIEQTASDIINHITDYNERVKKYVKRRHKYNRLENCHDLTRKEAISVLERQKAFKQIHSQILDAKSHLNLKPSLLNKNIVIKHIIKHKQLNILNKKKELI